MKLLPALLLAAALPACAADETPPPSFAPVICELDACVDDADAPTAVAVNGVLWLSVSAGLGESYSVRASDPELLSVTLVGNSVDVFAIAPGPVDLELLDASGDIVDDLQLTVVAPDRLVARMRWVEDDAQQVRTSVASESTLDVPVNAVVGITVSPYVGSFPIAGLIDYEIETTLPEGATLDTSGLSESILLMRAGEHTVTYRTGDLEARFVLSTP